jgi:hypothetical protein
VVPISWGPFGFAGAIAAIGAVDGFPLSHDHHAAVQMPIIATRLAAMTAFRGLAHRRAEAGGGTAVMLGDDLSSSAVIA